jgi:hypothetical protein
MNAQFHRGQRPSLSRLIIRCALDSSSGHLADGAPSSRAQLGRMASPIHRNYCVVGTLMSSTLMCPHPPVARSTISM